MPRNPNPLPDWSSRSLCIKKRAVCHRTIGVPDETGSPHLLDGASIVSIILPMKIVSTFVLTAGQRRLILEACPDADLADPTQVAGRKPKHALFDPEVMEP